METTKYSAKNAIQNNLFFHFLLFVFLSFFLIKPGHTQFAFELGAVSLYKDRGEDQDEKNKNFSPALQGGWQYHSEAGFFIGNWLSTGKFGKANVEIESLAGFGASITENIDLEFGYTHSIYPREGNENSGELFLSLIYQNLSFEIYSGMSSGVNQKNMYYNFEFITPIDDIWDHGACLG